MEQKPFWFFLITWTVHSMAHAWEHLERCLCRQTPFCMSPMNLRIHSCSQDSLWSSLVRSLQDGMYQATSRDWKNILTEILFLRSKSWWKVISSKPNQIRVTAKPCKTLPCLFAIFRCVSGVRTLFGMCFPWAKSNLSFHFWCIFFLLSG